MPDKVEKSTKPLKELSANEFKYVLDFFQLSVPVSASVQTKFNTLRYTKAFNKNFPKEYTLSQFLATLRSDEHGNVQFVNLKTSDEKHIITSNKFDSPCTVCKNEVLKAAGPLGDGLVCSKCACYYHNDCAPSPLTKPQIKALDNSPSNLLLVCPICMPSVSSFLSGSLAQDNANVLESEKNVTDIRTKINEIHYSVVAENKNSSLFHLLESIVNVLNSIDDKTDPEKMTVLAQEQLESLIKGVEDAKTTINNNMASIEHWAESAGKKLAHIEKLDVQELSKKMEEVAHAIEAPKELKLLQKTLEVQFKSFKDESKKILESRSTDSGSSRSYNIPDDDLEKLSESISKQLPAHEKSVLHEIRANTEKIIDDVKLIPVGVKANSRWDKIEESSKAAEQNSVPFANVTYSKRTKNSTVSPTGSTTNTSTTRTKKSLCNEDRTIAIDNVKSFDKFVKMSSLTKKEFNKHFEKVKVIHTKGTRNGTLLIELMSKEDADKIVKNWKPECFSIDRGKENKTIATLLRNKNLRCVVTDVDPDYTEEFINDEIKKELDMNEDDCISIRRFINKAGKRLFTVMVTFNKLENFQAAIEMDQILIGRTFCPFRKYIPKPHVVQCYNCYQFDHQANWCTKKKACPFCAQQHTAEDCPNKDISEGMRCVNCVGENKHSSTSQNCPSYVAKLESVSLYNNNYHGQH